jgi:maleate isomerase
MVSGYRARLGIICPAPAVVAEPEIYSVIPSGVSLCTTRVPLSESTPEKLLGTADYAVGAAQLLAQADVDVICFLCTAGSIIKGKKYDRKLAGDIEKSCGIKTVTTAGSVVEALTVLDVKRLVVATPYIRTVNDLERRFLESYGFEILEIQGFELKEPAAIRNIAATDVYRFARDLWNEEADCFFFSCTGVETFSIIQALEDDLGKPVVTSNQASFWCMLKTAGVKVRIPALGTLFLGE